MCYGSLMGIVNAHDERKEERGSETKMKEKKVEVKQKSKIKIEWYKK